MNSDGLMTTVLPAASAGASFHVVRSSGEFQGTIAAMTPSGSSRVVEGVGLVGRQHRAFDLVSQATVVVIPLRHVRRLHAHLGVQLAVVANFGLGQLLRALGNEIAKPAQQRTTARCGQLWPLAGRESLVRSANRTIDVGGGASWNERPRFRTKRIVALEVVA